MKHKVSELEGALLDAAVAKAHEFPWQIVDGRCSVEASVPKYSEPPATFGQAGGLMTVQKAFAPSSTWNQGGPIIERERVAIWKAEGDWCAAIPGDSAYPGDCDYIDVTRRDGSSGRTPLIAAMRAYVASKFGEEVEL